MILSGVVLVADVLNNLRLSNWANELGNEVVVFPLLGPQRGEIASGNKSRSAGEAIVVESFFLL